MKLFIFEPYEWGYCGGAIGVIAASFGGAVVQIIKEDIEQATEAANSPEYNKSRFTHEERVEDARIYKPEYFQRDKSNFRKDHWDQWLLTHEEELSDQYDEPCVLFDNWNYS